MDEVHRLNGSGVLLFQRRRILRYSRSLSEKGDLEFKKKNSR